MNVAQRIPVLMYHRVGETHNSWERRYCIAPEQFRLHMRQLANNGMVTCSLTEFFAWLSGEKLLPEGSFLLTFDDGFLGVFEYAVPVLQELGWSATIFLLANSSVSEMSGAEQRIRVVPLTLSSRKSISIICGSWALAFIPIPATIPI